MVCGACGRAVDNRPRDGAIRPAGSLAVTPTYAALLESEGIPWGPDQEAQLADYLARLRALNAYASLVSEGDLARLESVHVPDSLSLARLVAEACAGGLPHLDIGSGGGFPAVPLAVALPNLPMVLVERSTKKVGILRQIIGGLGLEQVRLVQGEFPGAMAGLDCGSVTARAVERPERILKGLRPTLAAGAVFLSQAGAPDAAARAMFHVEQVVDAWTEAGLRRGSLHRIRAAREER